MSALAKRAIKVLPSLTAADQEEVARFILTKAEDAVVLRDEEQAAVALGDADIKAGRLAPDGAIEALIARLRSDMKDMEKRLNQETDKLSKEIDQLPKETGNLCERMAHLEGLLEGLREAIMPRSGLATGMPSFS